ncbi:putative glycerophosphoryl diester phosphodiesterase [Staphylococcus phage Twort]|uniref:ORF010 n=2 Tax=Staphylococcus phage Twort (strain DSM 17442 / HER 48) TaxID=2908167 RepID=Q4Z9D6_BPTWO|nr:glycerophosphoryl diester phosphodiesterase [Staphylococcus phage Twort]AAX92306.1 ORF010 [Staphylococcus phage Twort]QIW89115.1 putative glycerophosphoryl diester phosphodiesterase [Staphylococcus phage Twort]
MIQLQSSLGKGLKQVDSDDFKLQELLIGKVVKVNYRTHTVEVNVNNNTLGTNPVKKGDTFSVPYPRRFIGTTPEGNTFGSNELITPGSVVLVGFLDSSYNNPIIVSTYGTSLQNKLLSTSPMETGNFKDNNYFKYFSVLHNIYPSMTYDFHDGDGSMIKTFNGKTFLSMTSNEEERPQATDYHVGTDYYDLYPTYYSNKKAKEPRNQKAPNVLFKHQGMFNNTNEPDKHITTFYIDQNGTIRFSVMEKDLQKRTFFEIDNEGNQKTVHQGDSLLLGEAQVWVEYGINSESNTFYVKNDKHKLEFTDRGLEINDRPILDNLDNSVEDALSNLETVRKGLEEINYLLDGVGKENIKELIDATKIAIEKSNKAELTTKGFQSSIDDVTSKLNSAIEKYDKFINETMKNYMDSTNSQLQELNQNYITLKNIVDPLKGVSEKVTALEDTTTPSNISKLVRDNYISNKDALTIEQVNTTTPTIIVIPESLRSASNFQQDLSNFSVELLEQYTEEQRISYIDSKLKTLEETTLHRLVGKNEYPLVVTYKDNNDTVKSFMTTNYELLYNKKFIPLDNAKVQISNSGIISKFKLSYSILNNPVEEKSFTSKDW